MSTLKVNRIENTSTTDGGVSIDTDGHVTIDGQQLPTAGPLSNRNLLANGSCKVAQRGTSTTTAVSGATFVADRWRYEAATSSVVTTSQSTDAPPGFTHSIKAEITTADTSTDATDFSQFLYKIEANDISHLNYGTAEAQTCTISFWVKHSLSGTYPFSLQNHDGTRVYPSSYVVNNANTWEYKTITFAGDTGGTWVTDGNALGMRFTFMWNMGSNFTGGTDGAWVTAAPAAYRNETTTTGPDINGTVGNTVQWAGVQLEVGSKSTPFEHESYSQTLAKCQRYYQVIRASLNANHSYVMKVGETTFYILTGTFATEMRTFATHSILGTVVGTIGGSRHSSTNYGIWWSALVGGYGYVYTTSGTNVPIIGFSAEL
jgi:hypothetical protein